MNQTSASIVSSLPPWKAYLDVVPAEDLDRRLASHCGQAAAGLARLASGHEDRAGYAYAAGKWNVRQLIGHVLASHRIFVARAVCIARGETQILPGYDENAYAAGWPPATVSLDALARAYAAETAATLAWLTVLGPDERARAGGANGTRVTPDQLLRSLIGHESHHFSVLRDRYGLDIMS